MKTNQFFMKYFILTLIVSLGVSSCSSDDDDPVNPEPDPEETTAIVASLRVSTPSGRIYYMGAYPEIPSEINYEDMVELGSNATIYSYGEHPYVWDGSASTLTKYNVNNTMEISAADALSFSSTGISGSFGPPAFVSGSEAYFFALDEGKVIQFDPETMTITQTHDVTPLENSNNPNINTSTYANYVTEAGKIILPVAATPTDFDQFPQYAEIAVFDLTSKSISYVEDTRMSMGYDTFSKGNDESLYYRPARAIALAEDYTSITDYPTTGGLLKVNPDGSFDNDFFVDLKAALNAHSVNVVPYVFDDKALVQYMEESFTPPADPDDWYSAPTKFALVDLNTLETEDFTSFEQYGTVYTIGAIDGVEYYGNFGATSGEYSLLKQNSATEFEIVSQAIGGSLGFIGKLR